MAGGPVTRAMRIFDLLLGLLGLIVALPVLLLAMAAIRLESPGSPIFAQRRIGRHRRTFICYKLRTMRTGTREGASHEIGGASITAAGRFLRRTKLDEVPQLWNVVKGEMSLVGPRPCLPSQTELIAERERLGLHAIRPGITGPSQVAGLDMSDPSRLAAMDARWDRSLRSYFVILCLTVLGRGRGDAAKAG